MTKILGSSVPPTRNFSLTGEREPLRGGAGGVLRSPAIGALLLLALVAAVFLQVGGFDFVNLDDDQYLTSNPRVAGGLTLRGLGWAFSSTWGGNWHPLTWLSHQADVSLFGMNPAAHHLVGLLLHALNAVLLFLLLRHLTGAHWRSLLVAALFAVHPTRAESVAWVAERKDLLSTFLALLAVAAWTRWLRRPGGLPYAAATALFALALMAKPMPVSIPFLLLLLDWWPLGRASCAGGPHRVGRLILEKAPLFALAAASSAVTLLAQRQGGNVSSLERLPLVARGESALHAWASYLGKAFWPRDLSFFYPHPGIGVPLWQAAAAGLLLAAVTLAAFRLRRTRPWLPSGWLWYLGTLVPVIGLVQVGGQYMADRYLYLPLVGIFLAVSWGAGDLVGDATPRRLAAGACASAAVLLLAGAAFVQTGTWRDSETLYRHALRIDPRNWFAWNGMGKVWFSRGQGERAVEAMREVVALKPRWTSGHFNLGLALRQAGRPREALGEMEAALSLNPRHQGAHLQAGLILLEGRRAAEALVHLDDAVRLDPASASAWQGRALSLAALGRGAEAQEAFRRAQARGTEGQ